MWTLDSHGILQSKGKRRDIMISDFLLLWFCLNLASLLFEKQKELANLDMFFEATIYFEYGKMEKKY